MHILKQLLGLHKLQKPAEPPPLVPIPQVDLVRLKQKKSTFFDVEVVGESHYQNNLRRIVGARFANGESHMTLARLVLEDSNPHDNKAVRVEIDGLQVGYLSRELAPKYREHLQQIGRPTAVGECRAKVRGDTRLGVYLDVPTP